MKEIDLVIFDMDGLLFDTETSYYEAMRGAMTTFGFDFPFETYKSMIGIGDNETNQLLQKICGPDFSMAPLWEENYRQFQKLLDEKGLVIKPGAIELLHALDEAGIAKCIASSNNKAAIENYLEVSGLGDRFDFYVSGDDVKRAKPDPDIFQIACRKANATADRALVLEDSLNGLRAANAAGIKCIIVPDMLEPNEEMKENAYAIVDNLEEVIPMVTK
ncbi:HAD family phosphatase [Virgibacillus sp. 179-BFC.A HS]|uniref:HAD family phosphatase n=1 Tax=Tigheibacillus jepli TaxID=3035914 RepID=A0ABU5CLL2_9BACI|nr:HAD family phosphatase [Virgibacillus sp. 179-BFC.A HS]MDY0407248.1 HAD family phosphatase [Virgibacillus sp. 179-BFC.A HS]